MHIVTEPGSLSHPLVTRLADTWGATVQSTTPAADFATLMHARMLVLSTSTFSLSAALLAPPLENGRQRVVHYPHAGYFSLFTDKDQCLLVTPELETRLWGGEQAASMAAGPGKRPVDGAASSSPSSSAPSAELGGSGGTRFVYHDLYWYRTARLLAPLALASSGTATADRSGNERVERLLGEAAAGLLHCTDLYERLRAKSQEVTLEGRPTAAAGAGSSADAVSGSGRSGIGSSSAAVGRSPTSTMRRMSDLAFSLPFASLQAFYSDPVCAALVLKISEGARPDWLRVYTDHLSGHTSTAAAGAATAAAETDASSGASSKKPKLCVDLFQDLPP